MNSITWFSLMAFSMKLADLVVGHVRSGVEVLIESAWMGPPDLVAEDVVDELVLLDAGQALEAVRDHLGAEMVAAARRSSTARVGSGQRRSMRCFSSVGGGHPDLRVPTRPADTILNRW